MKGGKRNIPRYKEMHSSIVTFFYPCGGHCVILLYILFSYMDALTVFILREVLGNISYL